jgi:hypothetical protein
MWEGKRNEWIMRLDAWPVDPSKVKANVHWFFSGKPEGIITPDQWSFLAFVWKKDGNFSQFWIGTSKAPAVSGRTGTRSDLLGAVGERTPEKRTIGNEAREDARRPFNGSIDNLRVFTKALDEAAIEKIRAADLANEQVTLP